MKKIYIFAAAAALFAACSSNEELTLNDQPQAPTEAGTVGFDAYMQRSVTRSGTAGDLTTEVMKAGNGFGVFGYYTDNNDYDQLAIPNFMWNQQVTAHFESTDFKYWEYSPIKYWPNEYGANAVSDDNDKVSFFAYAPYIPVASDGKAPDQTYGITGMTRNITAGDPIIKYIGSFDATKAVDLCWGVCQQSDWQVIQNGEAQEFALGKPWLNVQRPASAEALGENTGQKLKFQFLHALAKMQIDVDAFVDGYDNTENLNDQTKIWIRSVRFTGFTMKGALNLNNENAYEPYWMNYNGIGDLVADDDITIYDQRKDGKEGMQGATATNEKVGGLNEAFIQNENAISTGNWSGAPAGVTNSPANLFKNGGIFYVIPTGDPVEIEIIYDVETINNNLGNTISDGATPGSSIENRISKKIKFGDNITVLEAGKAYNIHLHLGMNSVKFDADVVGWDDMAAPDIDLPANMPAFEATSNTGKLDIPGADREFIFAVTGLKGGENVTANVDAISATAEVNSTSKFTGTGDNRANASGVVYVKVTGFAANTTIQDLASADITVTGALTTTATSIAVTQKAETLGLLEPETPLTAIKLRRTIAGTVTEWTTATTNCPDLTGYSGTETNNYIRVWRNGAELTMDSGSTADKFTFNKDTGTITLGTAAVAGEVLKVTIKAGNVPEETISFTF